MGSQYIYRLRGRHHREKSRSANRKRKRQPMRCMNNCQRETADNQYEGRDCKWHQTINDKAIDLAANGLLIDSFKVESEPKTLAFGYVHSAGDLLDYLVRKPRQTCSPV